MSVTTTRSGLEPTGVGTSDSTRTRIDGFLGIRDIRAATMGSLLVVFAIMLIATIAESGVAAGIVIVFSIALTLIGFIVGLLFSMPRAIAAANDSDKKTQSVPSSDPAQREAPLYSPNVNLEQVADWLTKIIVGVGLVEAQHISEFVWKGAVTLGGQLNETNPSIDADGAAALSLGMIVGFPLVGFIGGFFAMKLYISRAMYASEKDIFRPVSYTPVAKEAVEDELRRTTAVPSDAPPELVESAAASSSAATARVVDDVLKTPVEQLQTSSDLVTRARAALLKGNFTEAAQAFELALEKGETDPGVLLDYARTLARLKRPWSRIISVLEEARQRLGPATPPEIRRQVMWELMNTYLYAPAPSGFTAAIQLGSQYIAAEGRDDAFAYVYLASAFGQAYSYWKKSRNPEVAEREAADVEDAISKALEAARKDGIEDGIKRWLQSLATSSGEDDDLKECVEDHPKIGAEIGLAQRI